MRIRTFAHNATYFAACLCLVCFVRLGLSTIGYRRLDGLICRLRPPGDEPVDLRRVAWGVATAARFVPRATCLTQAVAGRYLLARKGQASTIRIGIDRNSPKALRAHAWLISGQSIVLGGRALDMSSFVHLVDLPDAQ